MSYKVACSKNFKTFHKAQTSCGIAQTLAWDSTDEQLLQLDIRSFL